MLYRCQNPSCKHAKSLEHTDYWWTCPKCNATMSAVTLEQLLAEAKDRPPEPQEELVDP